MGIDLCCITPTNRAKEEEEEESVKGDEMVEEGATEEGRANRGTARVLDEVMAMIEAEGAEEVIALTEASQEAATPTGVPE